MVTTERMNIYPISIEKLKEVVEQEENEILKIAYQEMLDGCLNYPEKYIWYTLWFMELKDSENEIVGNLSFKGIDDKGYEKYSKLFIYQQSHHVNNISYYRNIFL